MGKPKLVTCLGKERVLFEIRLWLTFRLSVHSTLRYLRGESCNFKPVCNQTAQGKAKDKHKHQLRLIVLLIHLREDRKSILPRNRNLILSTASHFDNGLSLFLLLDLRTFQNPYPGQWQDDKILQRREPLKPVWYKRPKTTKPQGSASDTILTDFIRYTQGQKADFAKATPVRETSLYTACGTKRREERSGSIPTRTASCRHIRTCCASYTVGPLARSVTRNGFDLWLIEMTALY